MCHAPVKRLALANANVSKRDVCWYAGLRRTYIEKRGTSCILQGVFPRHSGAYNVLMSLFVKQGTLTPLLGIGVCVSIQFGALEHTKRYFARQNLASGRGGPDGLTLSGSQLMAAGVFAGLANSVVSGPVEHIRIRT